MMLWTLLLSWAFAQTPAMPGLAPAPQGETRFVVADTETTRFLEGPKAQGPDLKQGEAVMVVTEANALVRIFVRGQFGWVPRGGLTTEPPALPDPAELPPLIPPG